MRKYETRTHSYELGIGKVYEYDPETTPRVRRGYIKKLEVIRESEASIWYEWEGKTVSQRKSTADLQVFDTWEDAREYIERGQELYIKSLKNRLAKAENTLAEIQQLKKEDSE